MGISTPPPDSEINLTERVFQNRIRRAEKALQDDQVSEAERLLREALTVPGPRTTRENITRDMIKRHLDQIIKRSPPPWPLVSQVTHLFPALTLENDQTRHWQRELGLVRAQFHLEHNEYKNAFDVLNTLIKQAEPAELGHLHREIFDLVRPYMIQQISNRRWAELGQLIEHFKKLRPEPDELHEWLDITAAVVEAARNDRDISLVPAQEVELIEQKMHHYRIWVIILATIIGLAIPIYLGVLFYLMS